MLRYLLIILMTMSSLVMSAQGPDGKGSKRFDPQKFEKHLEGYVLSKMKLSQKESAAFLPLFRQKRKAEVTIMDNGRKNRRQRPVSEKDWEEAIRAFDRDEVKLKRCSRPITKRCSRCFPLLRS